MSMSTKTSSFKRVNIYDSEVGTETRESLMELESDPRYTTLVSYTSDRDKYPEGTMPFVEKHLLYLHQHPSVNPVHYLSNLRLQLKVR
jgi:hypothetical protein